MWCDRPLCYSDSRCCGVTYTIVCFTWSEADAFFLITIPHLPTLVLAPLAGLESSDLSSKVVSPESLSRLSALVDEEEEDEELPSILSHQGEPSVYLL